MTVGVLGCGRMGGALAAALTAASCPVLVASARAGSATRLAAALPGAYAVDADRLFRAATVVVLALPFDAALDVADERGGIGAGRVVIDPTNPLLPRSRAPADPAPAIVRPGPVAAGPSGGELLATAMPTWRVVKAFNSVSAELLSSRRPAGCPVTVPVAGDDRQAREQVIALARRLGFDAVDAGGIRHSRELEALAVLLATISHSHRLGGQVGLHLVPRR